MLPDPNSPKRRVACDAEDAREIARLLSDAGLAAFEEPDGVAVLTSDELEVSALDAPVPKHRLPKLAKAPKSDVTAWLRRN